MITIKYLSVMEENFPITVSVQSLRHFDFSHRIRWPKIWKSRFCSSLYLSYRSAEWSQPENWNAISTTWLTNPTCWTKVKVVIQQFWWWWSLPWWLWPVSAVVACSKQQKNDEADSALILKIFLWPLYLCVDNHNRKIQCKQHSRTPNKEQQDKNARRSICMKILKKIRR